MITLTDMKIYGDYEHIRTADPTVTDDVNAGIKVGDRWLNTANGFSYACQDNTAGAAQWPRTFQAQDNKFDLLNYPTCKNIYEYLANEFGLNRKTDYTGPLYGEWSRPERLYFLKFETQFSAYRFASSAKTITGIAPTQVYGALDDLQIGDWIYARVPGRNRGLQKVTGIPVAGTIEVEGPLFDEDRTGFLTLAQIPEGLTTILGRILYFDIFQRTGTPGMKSERVGTYSWTKDAVTVGGNRYPSEVAGDLDLYAAPMVGGGDSFYVP